MALTPIQQDITIKQLDAWGSLTGIGGEILDGSDVQAYGKMTHGAPTDAISAGYFGTSKGKYRLVYPFNEQATILQGEVRITDESTGESKLYRAGDTWFVTKGTSTVWEVLRDGYTKHYLSFN